MIENPSFVVACGENPDAPVRVSADKVKLIRERCHPRPQLEVRVSMYTLTPLYLATANSLLERRAETKLSSIKKPYQRKRSKNTPLPSQGLIPAGGNKT